MAPSARSNHTELDTDGDEFDFGLQKTDRKVQRRCGRHARDSEEDTVEINNGTDIFFFLTVMM